MCTKFVPNPIRFEFHLSDCCEAEAQDNGSKDRELQITLDQLPSLYLILFIFFIYLIPAQQHYSRIAATFPHYPLMYVVTFHGLFFHDYILF